MATLPTYPPEESATSPASLHKHRACQSFGGQDNRLNNITVNGAYFNNAFGLGDGQPGGRTGVAPISLEAIEQIQVSIAPYDVRQESFAGAAVNTITRSGTNQIRGFIYSPFPQRRFRRHGSHAASPFNPGTFNHAVRPAGRAGAPIVKNKLFVFGNYENEKDARPLNSSAPTPAPSPSLAT